MAPKGKGTIFSLLTRQYSWKKDQEGPHDTIHESLSLSIQQSDERDKRIDEEISNWNCWLRSNETARCSDDVTLRLERQRGVLIHIWQEFQSHSRVKDASAPQYSNTIPTIEDLQAAVSEAQKEWNQKHEKGLGKAKIRLFDFLSLHE
ncbi:uncharacterized protein N7483_002838 [Penicillium malachiteum]|uniref:uncharacterized protein n=1 Tax=Penicillium malachiteum TaxID=1324776 RepID=UPI002546C93B|nr:uncharacterized protein N7483_002838 [Penicillium malachiteum]KAJ5737713.1 hypothetical protein N7483_002838 [Penicillium malachiteum]